MQRPMRDMMAEVISLAVVLPLLPATATTGNVKSARQLLASPCSARSVSGTRTCGNAPGVARSTRAPMAPCAAAAWTKAVPSKFGPRNATNSAPGFSVRLSVETQPKGRSSPMSSPPATLAASRNVRFILPLPASCRRSQQALRFAAIAEGAARFTVDLVVLMALARDQDQIDRLCFLQGGGDGFAAIVYHAHGAGFDALQNVARDRLRILGTRVVVGHDDLVRQIIRDPAHAAPLPGIAFAAPPAHAPHPALAMLAGRAQWLRQGIGRVRVVHHHGGIVGGIGPHHFHAARCRFALG